MAKKVVRAKSIKKKIAPKAKSTEVVYHSTKEIKVEKALIDNFIGLQKVMLNLSNKFDSLSNQISRLLDLFEISAKSLAKKELSSPGISNTESVEAKKIMEKLDNISKQAGLIGRGLALIHEVGTENKNPVIPLNVQRRNNLMPGATPLSTFMQSKQQQQNSLPMPSPSSSDSSQSSSDQNQESAKKMTKELDSESQIP